MRFKPKRAAFREAKQIMRDHAKLVDQLANFASQPAPNLSEPFREVLEAALDGAAENPAAFMQIRKMIIKLRGLVELAEGPNPECELAIAVSKALDGALDHAFGVFWRL